MKLSAEYISGLKYRYAKMALGITGEVVTIKEITPGELGATCAKPIIYLGFYHRYMKDLDKKHTVATIDGVFSHEVMHRLLSDFNVLSKIAEMRHAKILQIINNIMEDNYIEHCAPLYLGTSLIKSLNYMRNVVYEHAPNIEESATPFEQFINASIQYGDGGLLRGHFTDKQAKEIFFKTLPIVDAHMEEPDPNKRLQMAVQVMDIAKPLWEKMEKDAEAMSKMLNELEKHGKANMDKAPSSSSRSPMKPESGEMSGLRSSSIMKKRKKTSESNEEKSFGISGGDSKDSESSEKGGKSSGAPKSEKESHESDSSGDDSTSEGSSKPGEEKKTSDCSEKDTEASSHDSESDSSTDFDDDIEELTLEFDESSDEGADADDGVSDTDEGETSSDDESLSLDGDGSLDASSDEESETSESSSFKEDDSSDDVDSEMDDDIFTDEDAERVLRELEAAIKEQANEDKKAELDSTSDIVPSVKSNGYKNVCENVTHGLGRIQPTSPSVANAYDLIVKAMQVDINSLAKSLQRIFKADIGDKCYRTSGRVSVPRLASGVRSARVFTRKKAPNGLKDLHVVLLVDESGSTYRNDLIKMFQSVTIGLTETFAKLKIPISVIGFEADSDDVTGKRKEAIHRHYINGKNTMRDRYKLLQLQARNNNFDGYSIRYAGDYLRQINCEHKLLIVISDGIPACSCYNGYTGIRDTKQAIQEVSKYATVFGVLAGDCKPEIHREMYGYHFLYIKNTKEMFAEIGKVIQKEVKNWE